jgi:hypothetical protein
MTRQRLASKIITVLCSLASTAAFAVTPNPTPQRAYVSLSGSDTNSCGPTAPCRTFQAALAQVNPNGEVLVLDSGAYGTMTITQGVTVTAPPGVYAGISVFGGDGITINAPGANVVLRGLTVNGQGGSNGIVMSAGNSLVVDSCVVSNFPYANLLPVTGAGIYVNATAHVNISASAVSYTGYGIRFDGGATATITRTSAINNLVGIASWPWTNNVNNHLTVVDSVVSDNSSTGISVQQGLYGVTGSTSTAEVIRSTVSNNQFAGIYLGGGATITVTNSVAIANLTAFDNGDYVSTFVSAGNNTLIGNAHDNGNGPITITPSLSSK